jgi:uncharacterized protein YfdQ (DUF2303 family)
MTTPNEGHHVSEPVLDSIEADGPAQLAREVERLVRDNVIRRPVAASWDPPPHVLAEVFRPGDELVIRDMEQFAAEPVMPRGFAVVYDAVSFATLCQRWGSTDRTTLWAQQPTTGATRPSITAVFDDHMDHDSAGWREHRARLEVRVDPDWAAWARVDGKPMDQVELAEFLTDQMHVITQPRAAELISAVTTFSTKRNVSFAQAINLDSGETQFTYVDQKRDDAGDAVLPNRLTVSTRPFYGSSEVPMDVWVRYRLDSGRLTFTLQRIRPDRAEEAAWLDMCAQVAGELGDEYPFPLLQGCPPEPLR